MRSNQLKVGNYRAKEESQSNQETAQKKAHPCFFQLQNQVSKNICQKRQRRRKITKAVVTSI